MSANFSQANRPLAVKTPLGPDDLLLVGFRGDDALSRLFLYRLDMIAKNDTKIPFDAILGQKVTATFRWGSGNKKERYFNGICSRISQGERDATFTRYHMEVVPKAWLLTRKAQSRIFQHKTVPDILKKVLEGIDVKLDIQGTFEPRDYCVQYRETDFNFACRLMEEEGIFYFFQHSKESHTMVLANVPAAHQEVPVQPSVPYEEKFGGSRDENRISFWEKAQELRAGKYTLWDHSFELPHKHLEADKTIQESVAAGSVTHKLKLAENAKLEIYDYPGEYAQRFDGIDKGGGEQPREVQKIFQDNARTVGIRMQQEAVESLEIRGHGNCRQFVSGHKFKFQRHFNADGDYLLTSVHHAVSGGSAEYRASDAASTYDMSFTCIPLALPFRPPRTTPKPVVQGTQSAVVVGQPGEEIFTDKYGRVKVQFHWDREGQNNADSSCWIRVASTWAGKQWGMIHIPRVGQEVLVDFLEGDPDQPVVIGSLYNADMMPPYALPGNKTQSGIQSRSCLGGAAANYNEIKFEDKKGNELLTIHAERNQSISVEADESHSVGHDRTKSIEHDETSTIGHDRTETVQNNETITIANNRTEQVGTNETVTIGSARTHTIGAADTLTVGAARIVTVAASEMLTVGGALVITVGTQVVVQVGSSSLSMKADGSIELSGKDIKLIGSSSVKTSAPSVEISGATEAKMGSGSSTVAVKPEGVTISGAKIDSSAIGMHTISGAVIKLN